MSKADFAAWDCLPSDVLFRCYELLNELDFLLDADDGTPAAARLATALNARDIRAALIARQFGAHGVADAILGYDNGVAAMKKAFTMVATGPFDPKAPPPTASD